MAKTLDQVTTKWRMNSTGAEQAWVDGINNTTVDPTQLAIANESGYLSGVQAAVSTGLWRRNLAAAGKTKWTTNSVAKRASYTSGVTAGENDYSTAMTVWLPRIQQAAVTAKAMPGQTIDQRLARSAYVGRTLYNIKRGIS